MGFNVVRKTIGPSFSGLPWYCPLCHPHYTAEPCTLFFRVCVFVCMYACRACVCDLHRAHLVTSLKLSLRMIGT